MSTQTPSSSFWAVSKHETDIVLAFGNGQHKIYANKAVLRLWSPDVLATAISDCKLPMEDGLPCLKMDESEEFDVWKSIMPAMFPIVRTREQPLFELTVANVGLIFKLADKYGMKRLLQMVEDWLAAPGSCNSLFKAYPGPHNNLKPVNLEYKDKLSPYFWLAEADRMNWQRVVLRCAVNIGNFVKDYSGSARGEEATNWFFNHFPAKDCIAADIFQAARLGHLTAFAQVL